MALSAFDDESQPPGPDGLRAVLGGSVGIRMTVSTDEDLTVAKLLAGLKMGK